MHEPAPPSGMYPFYDELRIPRADSITRRLYDVVRPFRRLIPIPLHTAFPLLYEVYLVLLRLASRGASRRWRGQTGLLVNLGVGGSGKPGWVNVDIFPAPGVNCLYDCRKHLPFANNAVRGIFCEHFVEHLDYSEELPHFLSECRRVLQPGGVLRIIVPDAGRYLRAYAAGDWDALAALRPLEAGRTDVHFKFAYRTRMELINMIFRQGHHHKYAYDLETLAFVLRRYGFAHVVRQQFGHSLLPVLAIDRAERAPESLYVEAVK